MTGPGFSEDRDGDFGMDTNSYMNPLNPKSYLIRPHFTESPVGAAGGSESGDKVSG